MSAASSDRHGPSDLVASLNRLRWWWRQRIGWLGWLAAIALLAAASSWAACQAMAGSQAELLRKQTALRAEVAQRPVADAINQHDPHDAFRDALPMAQQRSESVAALLALLDKNKLSVDRADYLEEEQEPGLLRIRVTLPLEGGYAPTRELIASLLNALPNAAMDGLQLERPAAGDRLTGQLRLSLFFRRAGS